MLGRYRLDRNNITVVDSNLSYKIYSVQGAHSAMYRIADDLWLLLTVVRRDRVGECSTIAISVCLIDRLEDYVAAVFRSAYADSQWMKSIQLITAQHEFDSLPNSGAILQHFNSGGLHFWLGDSCEDNNLIALRLTT